MPMITADEARRLSGPTVEERVEDACDLIRKAAIDGHRRLGLNDPFWTRGGYDKTDEWKKAVQMLEDAGFDVTFFYEERQFVNMYTLVKW